LSFFIETFDTILLNPDNNTTSQFLLQVANPITKYPWCVNYFIESGVVAKWSGGSVFL